MTYDLDDPVDRARVYEQERYGLDHLLELAAERDPGFTPEMFAEMAGRFSRLREGEFDVDAAEYEELANRVAIWRERVLGR